MNLSAIITSILDVVIKLKSVKYKAAHSNIGMSEKITICIFSLLKEKTIKGSDKENININSTPPSCPMYDAVATILEFKKMK